MRNRRKNESGERSARRKRERRTQVAVEFLQLEQVVHLAQVAGVHVNGLLVRAQDARKEGLRERVLGAQRESKHEKDEGGVGGCRASATRRQKKQRKRKADEGRP